MGTAEAPRKKGLAGCQAKPWEFGARDGDRTHDIQNHNLALLPTELRAP